MLSDKLCHCQSGSVLLFVPDPLQRVIQRDGDGKGQESVALETDPIIIGPKSEDVTIHQAIYEGMIR